MATNSSISSQQERLPGNQFIPRRELQEFPHTPSLWQRPFKTLAWLVQAIVGLACLVALLVLAAAVPIVNFFAMGYLMEVQARVARTGRLRSAFYLAPAATRLCGILLGVILWLLPIRFLASATRDSWLLAPDSPQPWIWTGALVFIGALIAAHLLMAIGCGGTLWRFVRPLNNGRCLLKHLRQGTFWHDADQALREFVASFRLLHLLHLGLLGYVATYIWLIVPTLLFTTLADVTSTWQLSQFLVGCISLTLILVWLPLLLVHVATVGNWRAMFASLTVLRLAIQTPFRSAFATAFVYACSIVPLLYAALLKNQLPPHHARWDLMLVFILTVVPARVLLGWVYHIASRDRQNGSRASWYWRIWQSANGIALLAGVSWYVYFLYLAETGGELGQLSVWQFHALVLPLPY